MTIKFKGLKIKYEVGVDVEIEPGPCTNDPAMLEMLFQCVRGRLHEASETEGNTEEPQQPNSDWS